MKDPQQLMAEFEQRYGRRPEGVWAGPGRVNLIGEHTDYNDGFVLPFALWQAATVAVARTGDDTLTVRSLEFASENATTLGELRPFDAPDPAERGWQDYLWGVVWALREAGHDVGGLQVLLGSDVPLGAGLSSSAAVECAMVGALCDLFDLDIEPMDRAKLARVAENAYVGAPTGLLDQAASTLCERDAALFLDCRSFETRQVPLPMGEQGLELLVLDTRTPHSHVDGEYADRRRMCERAADLLGVPALRDVDQLDDALARLTELGASATMQRRVRHVVTENLRVLAAVATADVGALRDLGPLMDESHESMKHDFEITVPTVDTAVDVARREGALGARMTGGGFGGCIIALCPTDHGQRIGEAIAATFATRGWAAPEWFTATPAEGAHRVI